MVYQNVSNHFNPLNLPHRMSFDNLPLVLLVQNIDTSATFSGIMLSKVNSISTTVKNRHFETFKLKESRPLRES